MHSVRLSLLLTGPDADAAHQPVARQLELLDTSLAQLRQGDPQRPLLLPPTAHIQDEFAQITAQWQQRLR
ncbi:type IV pili methyl-accepting chemotaxis transducer N-terminal domain-containing protein [Massilia sp. B-10]|nr:type IV pili methyl-accepting chemotaxis transducer N-terminal domain-containing protein [Massilia sp. B-10]